MINQIGTLNENTLHTDLKWWYSESNDQLEQKVGNFVIDIVKDDLLIEIQISNFSAIKKQLEILLQNHKVKLVHPIIRDKWIVNFDTQLNRVIRRRLSPIHCSYQEIFYELVRIPTIIPHPNFAIELVLVQIEEIRTKNNLGNWRRKGWSIYDRKLIRVLERKQFKKPIDFLNFIPENLKTPFTNFELAHSLNKPLSLARKMSYCLKNMGMLHVVGKNRNTLVFDL